MRIGEVAQKSGVSVRALRYYEEHGLLSSNRSSSGQRHYKADAVEHVALIQHLFAAGISSASARKLLPAVEAGVSTPEIVEELRQQRAQIRKRVDELEATLSRLDEVIDVATLAHECPSLHA